MEIPDEEFFATLARITKVEKSGENDFRVEQTHVKELPIKPGLCPRITLWDTDKDYRCYGKTIRNICHISNRDLELVWEKNTLERDEQDCLVANKFNLEVVNKSFIQRRKVFIDCTLHKC